MPVSMTGLPGITPLDEWVKAKIGLSPLKDLSSSDLVRYQIDRLKWTIGYARENSPFYRDRLGGLSKDFLHQPGDMAVLPFTTEADLRERHLDMLCVSQSEIARVVTLQTSGSTAAPKRLYFTDEDLELTVDFFYHGMTTLARPGARVLILMPGQTPGSIGDLLKKALVRMKAEGVVHGPVTDPYRAVNDLLKARADCLVGLPTQVLGLARHPCGRVIPHGLIKSILLSADYTPKAIVQELEEHWGAPVFEHYGMTEMGLGGGVQCEAREGYHLRETDLFFEVVDPISGSPLMDGEFGEVVFTTLTRKGMPLIRYRTGDLARFLTGPCPCGSSLRRLGKIQGRIAGRVHLREGGTLSLPEMDEVLFRVPGVLNYLAELDSRNGRDFLSIQVYSLLETWPEVLGETKRSLMKISGIEKAMAQDRLSFGTVSISPADWPTSGRIKRILVDRRE